MSIDEFLQVFAYGYTWEQFCEQFRFGLMFHLLDYTGDTELPRREQKELIIEIINRLMREGRVVCDLDKKWDDDESGNLKNRVSSCDNVIRYLEENWPDLHMDNYFDELYWNFLFNLPAAWVKDDGSLIYDFFKIAGPWEWL